MKPIEIINQNITSKFLNLLSATRSSKLRDLVAELQQDYEIETVSALCSYALDGNSEPYMRALIGKNFVVRMDALYEEIRMTNQSATAQIELKNYLATPIDVQAKEVDYYLCKCGGKMNLFPASSEMRCPDCHYIQSLSGTVFNETNTDTGINKRGSYETSRHCRFHIERILALRDPNIPEKDYDKIRAWLANNGKTRQIKTLRCKEYRRCLKEIKLTDYNEYVPFIRQHISGVSPARLYDDEMRLLFLHFDNAATAYAILNEGSKTNLRFYPYSIFKILQMILKNDQTRFKSIVECIHFQRDDTIVANDRTWEQICDLVPSFTFLKTDTNTLFDD